MRVIEGAAFIAGPSCCLHLAQMGAEVIRLIQSRARRWSPLASRSERREATIGRALIKVSARSQSILRCPRGVQLAQRLAASGDGLS